MPHNTTVKFRAVFVMSLDYPEYEELRKQSSLLGWLWQVGDKGHYLGLWGH